MNLCLFLAISIISKDLKNFSLYLKVRLRGERVQLLFILQMSMTARTGPGGGQALSPAALGGIFTLNNCKQKLGLALGLSTLALHVGVLGRVNSLPQMPAAHCIYQFDLILNKK